MTRAQLRQQALAAAYKSEENKPPTRKEVQRWLEPVRKAVTMLLQGEYFEYEGNILMPVPWAKDRSMGKLGEGTKGLLSFLERLKYEGECNHLWDVSNYTVESEVLHGTLTGALTELKQIEEFIMTKPRKLLVSEAQTERIAILLEMQK